MAIIYSYPQAIPTLDDMIIGTRVDTENSSSDNQTVNFTLTSLLGLIATSTGAQNLQQVTNIGATTTNTITISNDLKVSGKYYDTANQQGTSGQILSSTGIGTQWINSTATGVTLVSATTAGDALDVTVSDPTTTPALAFTWAGNNTQLVDGGGNLQTISTYTLPLAADGTRGGVQIGYVENAKNYPVELSTEKMFVNVPWTDTPLPVATTIILGGVKLEDDTEQTVAANAVSTTASRTYGLQLNSSDQGVINVPWTDTDTTYTAGNGLNLSGTVFSADVNNTQATSATSGLSTTAGRYYAVQLDNDGAIADADLVVNVPWIDTWVINSKLVAGYVSAPGAVADKVWKTDASGNPDWRADADTGITTAVVKASTASTGFGISEIVNAKELELYPHSYDGGTNVGFVPTGGSGTTYLRGDGTWAAIPTGLIFKDVWDARDAAERGSGSDGGDPDLRLLTPADGWLYIVNIAGSATPNGAATTPNSWNLGDWCIYNGTTWTRVPATNSGVTLFSSDFTSTGASDLQYVSGTTYSNKTGSVDIGRVNLNATGTPGITTYLRGDNAWVVPPNTEYLAMTSTVLGLGKLFDDTEQTVAATAVSTTASRTYGIQMNSSDQLVTNVPWVDTQENTEWYARDSSDVDKTIDNLTYLKFVTATGSLATDLTGTGTTGDPFLMTLTSPNTQNPFQTIAGTGTNNTNSGVLLSDSGGTVLVLGYEGIAASQATNTILLTGTTYALSGIGTNNTDSGIRLTGTGTSAANTDVLILGTGATTVSQTGNTITINSAAGSYNWNVKDNQGSPISKTLANTEVLQFVMASHASAPTAVLTDTGGNSPYIMTLTGKDTTYSLATTSGSGLIPTLPNPHGGKFLRGDNTWVVPDYIPDTQNEYATSWVDDLTTNSLIALRLTESGAGSGTQDINIVQGSNMTFTYTDANNITLAATDNNDNTTYAFTITDPGGTSSNLTITPSTGTAQTIAFTGGTNMDIVPGTNQMTFNSTDQYTGTVTNIAAGIGLDTTTGSAITSTGTILVDYGPGTGNVITFSNGGTSGGTIDKTADYFMWSDTSDSKTVKHSLIEDLPFASASASGTVTSVTGGDGITASASTTVPVISVDYTTTGSANLISSALSSAITVPTTDEILILKSTGSAVGTVERTVVSKLPFTNNAGTLTAVTGTAPVVSSGGTTPAISMPVATSSANGYLSSTDWTTFNNKTSNTGTVTGVTGTAPVVSSGGTTPAISMAAATGSVNGYLTSTDWTTFNNKTSNTGTVTSVAGSAGTGISISGSPITSSGTLTITNTGVTSIVAGTNISISGATGAVTVNSTDQYVGTVTGTGTANYVSKWSSSSAQTNSLLRDDGVGLSVGDSADANYTFYINDEYGYKSNISVNAGIGFYATCAGVLTGTLFKGEASSGVVMTMLQNGTLEVTGDLIAYGSPSDKKLKENIKPIEKALDKVEKLEGVTFDWKENLDKEVRQTWIHDIGFIAQDVQKVIPELVRENEDGLLSMRHQGVTPILVEAIKELKAEIEELKLKPCNCNNCNCKE